MAKRKQTSTSKPRKAARKGTSTSSRSSEPATNYVVYETFADPQIPIEDVAQGMARAVAYEEDALQQILALISKCAGLKSTPELPITEPKPTAEAIEQLCEGAPAAYPLAAAKTMRRFEELITMFYPVIHESQSDDTLIPIIPFIGELSQLKLRSLRVAATAFMAPLYDCLNGVNRPNKHIIEAKAALDLYLKKRVLDVAEDVRVMAVSALPFMDSTLNDESADVRLAALQNAHRSSDRILEIAQKDVDVNCREAAVSLLEDAKPFLKDTEPVVCAAAAKVYLRRFSLPVECSKQGAVALAREAKLTVEAAVPMALSSQSLSLLEGAAIAGTDAEVTAVQLVTAMAELLDQFTSEQLIASTIRLFKYVDLDAALARNLEQDIQRLFAQICKLYAEHPNQEIQKAFSIAAKPLMGHEAFEVAARTQITETVEQLMLSKADLMTRTGQIAVLGRFVDISDFDEDIYSLDKPEVFEYARNVAFHGDSSAITDALEYLAPRSVEDLLKVLVVAQVRGVGVNYDTSGLSLVGVERGIIRAARAAEVLA